MERITIGQQVMTEIDRITWLNGAGNCRGSHFVRGTVIDVQGDLVTLETAEGDIVGTLDNQVEKI